MQYLRKKICILLLLTLLAGLCACSERAVEPAASAPELITQGSVTEPDSEEPAPALPAAAVTETPAPTSEPTPEPVPEETPEPRAERVTDDYFADAAFFGNSLMDGLHRFGGLEYGAFFAGTSASVLSVENIRDARLSDGSPATLLDALLEQQYGKIYVLLGINELGFNTQAFVELYAGLLDKIAEAEPAAEIFVMSLTPITQKRSSSEDLFTRERVEEFNAAIRSMTEEHGFTYLDLYTAFADENGWLPEAQSTDGVHFTAEKYLEWAEYLRTNYDGCAPEC